MPADAGYGDDCSACGAGHYSQHEDRLQLEIRRLNLVAATRTAQTLKDGGVSPEAALESMRSQNIEEEVALKAIHRVGFERPANAHVVAVTEALSTSDVPTEVKA